jgi:hypothetical protein
MSFPGPSARSELTDLEKHLVDTHWDDTLDGDRTNFEDIESFLDPFLNTIRLQQSES